MHVFRPILVFSILALFTAMAIFGLPVSMITDSHGNMGTCPFMQGTASMCRMNTAEHIQGWQSIFTTTVPEVSVLFIAFALILGRHSNFEYHNIFTTQRFYEGRNSLSIAFNYLRIALREGILHPKIYDHVFLVS